MEPICEDSAKRNCDHLDNFGHHTSKKKTTHPTTTTSGSMDIKEQVFSIQKVWNRLVLYLTHADLKAARLVNKEFNTSILSLTDFVKNTIVNLVPEGRLSSTVFGTTNQLWIHFKIPHFNVSKLNSSSSQTTNNNTLLSNASTTTKSASVQDFEWLYPLLRKAESMEIAVVTVNSDSPPLDKLLEAPGEEQEEEQQQPDGTSLYPLQKLILQANVFHYSSTTDQLTKLSTKAIKNLENLVDFSILAPRWFFSADEMPITEFKSSTALIQPHLKKLQHFKLEPWTVNCQRRDIDSWYLILRGGIQFCQSLIQVMEQNRETLVGLYIKDMYLWSKGMETANDPVELKFLVTLIFPQLKSLSIRSHVYETDNLIKFIEQQPELEELDVRVLNDIASELFTKIKEKSGHLKKLRVATKAFSQEDKKIWDFLKDINSLEEFYLDIIPTQIYESSVQPLKVILRSLPPSLQKVGLKLRTFDEKNDHSFMHRKLSWVDVHVNLLRPLNFSTLNPKIVTYLTIVGCPGAVDDETMEYICRTFKKLEHLDLTGSSTTLTSYGITGEGGEGNLSFAVASSSSSRTPFSIRDLKYLKYLAVSCDGMTDSTPMLNAIRLPELNFFQFGFSHRSTVAGDRITRDGLLAVVKNNPNLSKLVITNQMRNAPLLSEFQLINPRIEEFIKPLDLHEGDFAHFSWEEDEDESSHSSPEDDEIAHEYRFMDDDALEFFNPLINLFELRRRGDFDSSSDEEEYEDDSTGSEMEVDEDN